MKEKDSELTVYWAPAFNPDDQKDPWLRAHGSLVYPDPKSLHSDLMSEKNPDRGPSTFLSCAAAVSSFNRTAVFYNSIDCTYDYDLSDVDNPKVDPKDERYLNFFIRRPPALLDKPTVEFQLRYSFFCEEPLEMSITPPMFHKPRYTRYATAVPGQFNIGKWFRPFVFEIQLWEPKGTLSFEAGEPLFYAKFDTDRKIKMQRFVYTKQLEMYSATSVNFYKNEKSLDKRYDLFESTSMRELVLKEVKNNLV
jgi:hypothetical protein